MGHGNEGVVNITRHVEVKETAVSALVLRRWNLVSLFYPKYILYITLNYQRFRTKLGYLGMLQVYNIDFCYFLFF